MNEPPPDRDEQLVLHASAAALLRYFDTGETVPLTWAIEHVPDGDIDALLARWWSSEIWFDLLLDFCGATMRLADPAARDALVAQVIHGLAACAQVALDGSVRDEGLRDAEIRFVEPAHRLLERLSATPVPAPFELFDTAGALESEVAAEERFEIMSLISFTSALDAVIGTTYAATQLARGQVVDGIARAREAVFSVQWALEARDGDREDLGLTVTQPSLPREAIWVANADTFRRHVPCPPLATWLRPLR